MTKVKCDHCGKMVKSLENWGIINLCKDCVKYYKKELPKTPPINRGSIKIEKPKKGCWGTYNPTTGEIEFTDKESNQPFEGTINHEFMHYLLHRLMSLRCCYQYDNVKQVVDSYHS